MFLVCKSNLRFIAMILIGCGAATAQPVFMANMAGSARTKVTTQLTTAPSIAPISKKAIKVNKGDLPINFDVAIVADPETPAGNLVVTSVSIPPGVSVTNIVNTNGIVTADFTASCGARLGKATLTLEVSDGEETSEADIEILIKNSSACGL